MKKVARGFFLFFIAVVFAAIFMAFVYPGPKKTLILKANLFGPSYWDLALLNTLEFGWEYGKIHARYYGRTSIKWDNPLPLENYSVAVSVRLIFESKYEQITFYRKVVPKKSYYASHQRELFEEIKKAKGVAALILETKDEEPLSVLEKSKTGEFVKTWNNSRFFLEIREITNNKELYV